MYLETTRKLHDPVKEEERDVKHSYHSKSRTSTAKAGRGERTNGTNSIFMVTTIQSSTKQLPTNHRTSQSVIQQKHFLLGRWSSLAHFWFLSFCLSSGLVVVGCDTDALLHSYLLLIRSFQRFPKDTATN